MTKLEILSRVLSEEVLSSHTREQDGAQFLTFRDNVTVQYGKQEQQQVFFISDDCYWDYITIALADGMVENLVEFQRLQTLFQSLFEQPRDIPAERRIEKWLVDQADRS